MQDITSQKRTEQKLILKDYKELKTKGIDLVLRHSSEFTREAFQGHWFDH